MLKSITLLTPAQVSGSPTLPFGALAWTEAFPRLGIPLLLNPKPVSHHRPSGCRRGFLTLL